MKARHICAALGIALATGSIIFMHSLIATNDAQAPTVARQLTAPWSAWQIEGLKMRGRRGAPPPSKGEIQRGHGPAKMPMRGPRPDLELPCVQMQIDYRPGGHVLQGPPMTGIVAPAAPLRGTSPYGCAPLVEGRWVDESAAEPEMVCTRGTLIRFAGEGELPALGTIVKFIGEKTSVAFKIVGYFDTKKLPQGWPGAFVNRGGFDALEPETKGRIRFWKTAPMEPIPNLQTVEDIAPQFTSDSARNMNRARPLLLWAAALTALCLLLNSLFLSIEHQRRDLAILRMLGLTRSGVVGHVLKESILLTCLGVAFGLILSSAALFIYVACEHALYPMGAALSWTSILATIVLAPILAILGALLALKKALAVKPLEAASNRAPRRASLGMLISFACGFGAFVAVEVWGSSLTKPFIPSKEWPDAIVSILPGGVSSFDIEKLRHLPGVKRISELQPLQLNFEPLEEMKSWGGPDGPKQYRNALLLAAEWLPDFKFIAGDHKSAAEAIKQGDACVITEMMARARHLKFGDDLCLDAGHDLKVALKIVGIIDLNWHMVTSRGLVRGLNRMPGNTDGPIFVSFDTLQELDMRPAEFVNMTHVWLDYEPKFLAEHGVFPAGRIVEKEIVDALNGANRTTKEGDVRGNAVRLHSRDEVADGTLAHGNDIVGSMARVPFIFIAIISLGFIAMLVASIDARKDEFIILRAVGATRTQLALVLIREAVVLALKAMVLGLIGGSILGWLATTGTRAAMANWGLPACFSLPVGTVVEGALGALIFALVIAVPTAFALIHRATKR